MKKKSANPLLIIVKTLLIIAVFYVVAMKINAKDMLHAFNDLNWTFGYIGIALSLAVMAMNLVKWRFIVHAFAQGDLSHIIASFFAGYTLALVTPGGVGELGRCFFLPNIHRNTGVTLTIIDKLFNLLLMIIFGAIAFTFIPSKLPVWIILCSGLFAGIIITFMFFYIVAPRSLYAIAVKFPKLRKSHAKHYITVLRKTTTRANGVIFSLSLLSYILYTIEFTIFAYALGVSNYSFAALAFMAAILIKNLIPLSVADIGVRELSLVGLFSLSGYAPEPALAASFLQYFANILFPSLIGLIFVLKKGGFSRGKK